MSRTLGRAPIWIGLAAIVGLSWLYLARMNAAMPAMEMAMPHPMAAMPGGGLQELALAFAMWCAMMAAMMVPTVVPALRLFMSLSRRRSPAVSAATRGAMYAAGYLAAWIAYAAPAALAQWALTRVALLSPMVESTSVVLSGAILLAAGIFQFTPLKDACLAKCRTPFAFFLAEWRDGAGGALAVGLRHGGYCVACCWALMAVMFVVGAMNLLWMVLFTVFVLGEKLAPARWRLSRISGAALIAWGGWLAAATLL